jgi:hypothetical protein
MRGDVERWLAGACADADDRGLPELKPLLEGLARATDGLRGADPQLSGAAIDPEDDRDHTP